MKYPAAIKLKMNPGSYKYHTKLTNPLILHLFIITVQFICLASVYSFIDSCDMTLAGDHVNGGSALVGCNSRLDLGVSGGS